jgi:hypothetical protein
MKHLVVFVVTIALDIVWASYIRRTSEGKRVSAALLSSGTILLGGFNSITIVHDPRYIGAAALGAFVGTFGLISWEKRKKATP